MGIKKAIQELDKMGNRRSIGENITFCEMNRILEALAEEDKNKELDLQKVWGSQQKVNQELNARIDKLYKEAFAEPEEGEKNIKELIEKLPADAKRALARVIKGCSQPDQPFKFGEGDLVRKDREKAIFQKYDSTEPQEEWCCVLIATFGGHLSDRHWRIRDIELIERGYCLHRLKSLRNKLTGS